MTVPPLPLEVVSLIVDHAAASAEDEQERRRLGVRIALVCRAWKELGVRAAWRILTLDMDKDEHLLAFLLERPTVLSNVRELDIKGLRRFEEPEDDEDDEDEYEDPMDTRAAVQRLFDLCPRIDKLSLDQLSPTLELVDMASRAPLQSTLRSMSCCVLGEEAHLSRLAATLSTFPRLRALRVFYKYCGTQPSLPAPPFSKVKLRCFELLLLGVCTAAEADTSIRTILSLCDISAIKDVYLMPVYSVDSVLPFFTPTSLTKLLLSAVSHPVVRDILASLVVTLPSLINLHSLSIIPEAFKAITYAKDDLSPVPLHTVLSAFPPSLCLVHFSGLYFEFALPLPVITDRARIDAMGISGIAVFPFHSGRSDGSFNSDNVRNFQAVGFRSAVGRIAWALVL
ncbi:hypothetical protein JCM6882_002366 [Rhodosporidiobolus microsporus]